MRIPPNYKNLNAVDKALEQFNEEEQIKISKAINTRWNEKSLEDHKWEENFDVVYYRVCRSLR